MGIVEKIKDIEAEMARTQKNKATEYHLGAPFCPSTVEFPFLFDIFTFAEMEPWQGSHVSLLAFRRLSLPNFLSL